MENGSQTFSQKIILLSSFHKIHGKCNPDELYKIIEEIQPDVIFEELSYNGFRIVYSDGYIPRTIEAITIKKYLQKYPIMHFPVDNYPINEFDLLSDAQVFLENSNEYGELWNQKLLKLHQMGYSYINSADCIETLERINIIEETVLSEINNLKLMNEFLKERELHHNREYEMLRNIYNYSKEYPYNLALFICGVDHRKPLKKKIQEYEAIENLKLNWTFYNEI